MNNFKFGQAIEALKQGRRVSRNGWNGEGMFVFMRPSDEIHIDAVIDVVKSLPDSVKHYYMQDVLNDSGNRVYPSHDNDKVKFSAYLCLKTVDGAIANGWVPSQSDMLSEDWCILD